MWRWQALGVVCGWFQVSPVLAQPNNGPSRPKQVMLRTLPSDACFSTSRFIAEVHARIDHLNLVPTFDEGDVEVQINRAGEHYDARLNIQLPDGSVLTRSIAASDCDEASQGIAFVAAVALDRTYGTGPVEPDGVDASPRDAQPVEPMTQRKLTRTYRGQLGAGVHGVAGALPRFAVGPRLSFLYGQNEGGAWAPAFSLGGYYIPNVDGETDDGEARFDLVQFDLGLCPTQARISFFSLRPCGYATAGFLHAAGRATQNEQAALRFYATIGAELLLDFALGTRIHLELGGFGAAPLIRDEFELGETVFHRPGLVTYGFASNLSVRLF